MNEQIKQRITQLNNGEVPRGYEKTDLGIFPHEWIKDKTLNKLCDINPKTNSLPDQFIYLDLESVIDRKIIQKNVIDLANAPSRAQRVLSKYDIIFQMVRPYQKNNLLFDEEDEIYSTVASTGYALLRSETYKYLFQLIHADYFVNQVNAKCTGTNYPAINSDDLSKIVIAFPKSFEEQSKIGTILSKWDEAIKLQEKQLDNLKVKKDAVLQRLIKKDDSWLKISLRDILKERTEFATKDEGYPHVTLSKSGVSKKTEQYNRDFLVKSEDKKYKVTRHNDICYNPANLKFGVICINKLTDESIFSPIYITYEVNPQYNVDFIGAVLCSNDFIRYIRKYEEGTVYERQAVKSSDFLRGEIWVPSTKEEQDRIASIIEKIDDYIKMEQQKYEMLCKQRKALQQYLLNGIVRV